MRGWWVGGAGGFLLVVCFLSWGVFLLYFLVLRLVLPCMCVLLCVAGHGGIVTTQRGHEFCAQSHLGEEEERDPMVCVVISRLCA